MSKTKFALRDWEAKPYHRGTYQLVDSQTGMYLGRFDSGGAGVSNEATATFAAAAPSLYQALEIALEPCGRGAICPACDCQPHDPDCIAEAALKRARGEQ